MITRLGEIASLFFKLGVIGFGGPAVHIANLEHETVERRKWLSRQEFLDLVGATNLIPGPNSTEMAMHIGMLRGGILGLILAGLCFVTPAIAITTLFAWLYVEYGQLPQATTLLVGIKPAVLAIILVAGWRLGRKAIKQWRLAVIALGVAAASFHPEITEIAALAVGGLLGVVWLSLASGSTSGKAAAATLFAWFGLRPQLACAGELPLLLAATSASAPVNIPLWQLGLFFLKVGAVLYGSGYVLIAYLEGGLVHEMGLLTQSELLDAIAVGQFTPGPILSTAAFVGYVVMGRGGDVAQGVLGAATAGTAIFLPSFVFVSILHPIVPRLRKRPLTAAFLDSVNAASIGLLAAVGLKLLAATLIDVQDGVTVQWRGVLIALVSLAVLLRWKISSVWIVLGGAAAGWLLASV
jgi:chromate transporter